ncbi:MAG: Hpt domain-containing protein [Treponema sp.]|jgi:HPt (histidine-containing phosphotransfer) domain-containing protein|nr:Hpt domain-containing protein [Treponema sp.]
MTDIIYVNVEEGTKRVMNNTKLYAKLLGKFKDDKSLTDVKNFLDAGDFEKAKAAAHTLKGLAANLSLIELFNQTLELETQIKAKSVNPGQFTAVENAYAQTLTETDKVIAQYG